MLLSDSKLSLEIPNVRFFYIMWDCLVWGSLLITICFCSWSVKMRSHSSPWLGGCTRRLAAKTKAQRGGEPTVSQSRDCICPSFLRTGWSQSRCPESSSQSRVCRRAMAPPLASGTPASADVETYPQFDAQPFGCVAPPVSFCISKLYWTLPTHPFCKTRHRFCLFPPNLRLSSLLFCFWKDRSFQLPPILILLLGILFDIAGAFGEIFSHNLLWNNSHCADHQIWTAPGQHCTAVNLHQLLRRLWASELSNCSRCKCAFKRMQRIYCY